MNYDDSRCKRDSHQVPEKLCWFNGPCRLIPSDPRHCRHHCPWTICHFNAFAFSTTVVLHLPSTTYRPLPPTSHPSWLDSQCHNKVLSMTQLRNQYKPSHVTTTFVVFFSYLFIFPTSLLILRPHVCPPHAELHSTSPSSLTAISLKRNAACVAT